MIPNVRGLSATAVQTTTLPSKNYAMQFEDGDILGFRDKVEAMKQVVFKILNTTRYDYVIYSWNYGIELADLFGQPMSYCEAVIPSRVREALMQDDRIDDVTDFAFTVARRGVLFVTFTVQSVFGAFESSTEVAFAG